MTKKPNRLQRLAARIASAFEDYTGTDTPTVVNHYTLNQPAPQANITNQVRETEPVQGGEFTTVADSVAADFAIMQAMNTAPTERALPMQAIYEQVFIAARKRYPMAYIVDLYAEDKSAMYAILAEEGKLYRSEITIDAGGSVLLSEWQPVQVDYMPAPAAADSAERAADAPTPGRARVSIVRQADGRVRWFSQSCSAVLNRSGEIDGTALFDSFIRHAQETDEYPIRMFYHAGEGFRTGQADWLARDGFVYLTSGLFDDSDIARAEVAARQREPEYWGESIGYDATKPPILVDVGGGVRLPMYVEGIHREISTLPEKDAAAIFTRTAQEVTRMTLSQRQFDELVHLFGDEAAARKWLEENPEATNRQIMQAALVARATPPPGAAVATATATASAPAEGESDEEEPAEEGTEAEAELESDEAEESDESETDDGDGEAETEREAGEVEEYQVDDNLMAALTDGVIASPSMQNLFAAVQSIQASLDGMSRDATAIRMRDSASLAALAERLDSLEAETDQTRSIWQDDLPARRRVAVTYRPREHAEVTEPALDMATEAEAVTDSFPA